MKRAWPCWQEGGHRGPEKPCVRERDRERKKTESTGVCAPEPTEPIPDWVNRAHIVLSPAAFLLLGSAWAVSQHALGKTVQGHVPLNGLSGFERRCIDAFPSDAAMNHIDVLLALHLNTLGENSRATAMVCKTLEARPHSLAAAKAWWSMQGSADKNPWDCSEFLRIHHKLPCSATKER